MDSDPDCRLHLTSFEFEYWIGIVVLDAVLFNLKFLSFLNYQKRILLLFQKSYEVLDILNLLDVS